jgi:proline iminopeptidase
MRHENDAYRHPPIEPYRSGWLDVGDGHRVFYEESGRPDGLPVLELHGGPGAGTVPDYRRLFDPQRWRLVAFDQRGCGRSLPLCETAHNTTQHLVADIERLREHLGIERWVVTGWSWGTTLALAYAQAHAQRVSALVLRGAWTATAEEAEWFERGMQHFFPDALDRFETRLPGVAPADTLQALFARASDATLDASLREAAARDYSRFELRACFLEADDAQIEAELDRAPQLPIALISAHYWAHRWFLGEGQLWTDLPRITHLPCTLIHGRYDVVTVPRTSHRLHQAWPGSELVIAPRAGHLSSEPEMARAITAAMERLALRLA